MKTQMVTGSMRRSAAILAIAIAVVGCTAAKQTQKIVILPTSTPTEMPTAEPTPTPMPSESPSALPSGSPSASLTASPTPPPAGGGVESCTGTADMRDLWKEAANNLSFDVYCAVLPSSWWVQNTEWKGKPLTYVTISYKNAKGWLISVGEGNFCSGAPLCWTSISDLGAASFGDRAGQLKLRAAGQYAVYVDAGTTHGYQIIGQGMSQSDLVAWAAGMVKVARS
jgi:hypothetical protein